MRIDLKGARMTISRSLSFLAAIAFLFSCSGDLSPDQRAVLAQSDKLPLYFLGSDIEPPQATQKITAVTGYSCKTAWLQSSASEEDALRMLWNNAAASSATAAVNVSCVPISFFTPQIHCWPGFYCTGDAVK